MPGQSPVLKGSDEVTPMLRALYELNLNNTKHLSFLTWKGGIFKGKQMCPLSVQYYFFSQGFHVFSKLQEGLTCTKFDHNINKLWD